eukprot:5882941-Pleurochrysis_carterae.AAC.1
MIMNSNPSGLENASTAHDGSSSLTRRIACHARNTALRARHSHIRVHGDSREHGENARAKCCQPMTSLSGTCNAEPIFSSGQLGLEIRTT